MYSYLLATTFLLRSSHLVYSEDSDSLLCRLWPFLQVPSGICNRGREREERERERAICDAVNVNNETFEGETFLHFHKF